MARVVKNRAPCLKGDSYRISTYLDPGDKVEVLSGPLPNQPKLVAVRIIKSNVFWCGPCGLGRMFATDLEPISPLEQLAECAE